MQLIRTKQGGFTISELLVGMVVGLLVMGAVISVYLGVLRTSGSVIKGSRLNQEMSAIMTIMSNDIRRAGYWGTGAFSVASDNPFSQIYITDAAARLNTSALRVHNNASGAYLDVTYDDDTTGQGRVTAASVGSCVVYTYDDLDTDNSGTVTAGETGDGILEDNEKFGFRWNGAATDPLMIRTSNTAGGPNTCTAGNWEPVTDPAEIEIMALSFDITGSLCTNASEPDGVDDGGAAGDADVDPAEFNCYNATFVADTGEHTVESRLVVITLTARLVSDPDVSYTLEQTVELRNNLIRVRP